jgi:uncharacterized Zn finger protein
MSGKIAKKREIIYCPNCGNHAEREYFKNQTIIQTSCPSCDYFMVNCSLTGKVVEAYAPGIALRF